MKNIFATLKVALAGILGAAATGGATAATQYISTSGATQDWQAVGSAAAAGALTGAVAYLVKSPLKP
jgi:hypothetical protein